MSEVLRPCPFCGGKADAYISLGEVRCIGCDATASMHLWNIRVTEDNLRSEIEHLCGILDFFGIEMEDDGGFKWKPSVIEWFREAQMKREDSGENTTGDNAVTD